jgi:hypothetical protein
MNETDSLRARASEIAYFLSPDTNAAIVKDLLDNSDLTKNEGSDIIEGIFDYERRNSGMFAFLQMIKE